MGKIFTEKRKREILAYIILWLIFVIVFVVPVAVATVDSTYNGKPDGSSFLAIIIDYILSLEVRVKAFQEAYIGTTGIMIRNFSLFYVIFAVILMLKTKDGAYHDIEHGSSDWSQGGEQYKVLSKSKGILLAEKNYLPVDKKGNVNVLIVGRIWCW